MNPRRVATPVSFTAEQLLAVGGVLAILIGVLVGNTLVAARVARRSKAGPVAVVGPPFVGKYAQLDGSVVGKVTAIEGDHLLIEQGGIVRKVPVAQAKDTGHDVILTGQLQSNLEGVK